MKMKEKEKVIISGRSFKIHRSRRSRRIVLCVRRRSGRRRREGGGGADSSLSSTSIIFQHSGLSSPRLLRYSRDLSSSLYFSSYFSSQTELPCPSLPRCPSIRVPLREESHDDESVSSHVNEMQQCRRESSARPARTRTSLFRWILRPSIRPSVDPRSDLPRPAGRFI